MLHIWNIILHICLKKVLTKSTHEPQKIPKKVPKDMKHTFNLNARSIRLVVSHDGKKYRKATGLIIDPALWNQKAQSLRAQCKSKPVFNELSTIHSRLIEREPYVKTEDDVEDAIAYALGIEPKKKSSRKFWDYFKEWSERDSQSKRYRQLAYRRISDLMGTKEDWEEINGDWYFRFMRKCDEQGYSHNYKSTLTAKLKTVMKEGYDRGLHTSEAFRKFVTSYRTADSIALTKDEVDALWKAKLTGKQADARDVFIVGVYCAGRFQDYSKLSEENITGDRLRYVQRKTGQIVLIPVSPRIKKVFERHDGRCPAITEQEVGRHMKKICENLGGTFNDIVEIRVSRGSRTEIERKHRYELVSCHTARRTGASILYKSGVPIALCRKLTGHTTDAMFMNYVKMGKEEAAELLAKSDFFK